MGGMVGESELNVRKSEIYLALFPKVFTSGSSHKVISHGNPQKSESQIPNTFELPNQVCAGFAKPYPAGFSEGSGGQPGRGEQSHLLWSKPWGPYSHSASSGHPPIIIGIPQMHTNASKLSETAQAGVTILARITAAHIPSQPMESQILAWQALGELLPGKAGEAALMTAKALRQADAAQLRFPELLKE